MHYLLRGKPQFCIHISFSFQLSMDFSQHGAEIFVPGEVFASNSATKASTIVYKTLNNILTLKKEDAKNEEKNGKTKFKSGSNIVSATILPLPVSPMRKPIKFVFHHKNKASYQTAKKLRKDVIFMSFIRKSLSPSGGFNLFIVYHFFHHF